MTKEEIIEMARQAGFADYELDDGTTNAFDVRYETFAKLVVAKEQEPVAWGVFDDNLHDMFFAKEEAHEMVRLKGDGSTVKPLYATPPQRKPLTDEEIWKFWWSRPEVPESEDDSMEEEFVAAVRAVLAAHGIKE